VSKLLKLQPKFHINHIIFLLSIIAITAITVPSIYAAKNFDVDISAGAALENCKFGKTCFKPYQITIIRGDTVTWTNLDNTTHTVTGGNPYDGPNYSFDSGLLQPGEKFSQAFHKVADFNYYCTLHPWMIGAVFVEGGLTKADLRWLPETIKILGPPDSLAPKVGEKLSITAEVRNLGQADAMPAQFSLQVIDENGLIVHQSWDEAELAVRQIELVTYEWIPQMRGTYKIVFDADLTRRIVESNESNNHYEMTIKVIDSEALLSKSISLDSSINVYLESKPPKSDEKMSMYVTFTDTNDKKIEHINYLITARQDGELVFFENNTYVAKGEGLHTTRTLHSENPVDIQVTILGIGLPDDQDNWSGPKGEVFSLQVIPEFPTSLLVLAATISMLVIFTAKTQFWQRAQVF
jgi:plastocyanin